MFSKGQVAKMATGPKLLLISSQLLFDATFELERLFYRPPLMIKLENVVFLSWKK